MDETFNKFRKWWLIVFLVLITFVIGILVGLFCKGWFLCLPWGNLMVDLVATALAIIALFIVAFYFKRYCCSHWAPIALIIAVLAILFGAVIYNPHTGSLPIERMKMCDCEFCFTQQLKKEGKIICLTKDLDISKSPLFCNFIDSWKKGTELRHAASNIGYKELLDLCCSYNAKEFSSNLNDLKSIRMKDIEIKNISPKILELLILGELGLQTMQKSISECVCSSNACPSCCTHQCDKCD